MRILMIEDAPADVDLVIGFLQEQEELSCEIDNVGRLAEALERLQHENWDVVLLELSLSDSRGLGTLECVRFCANDIPIVVISADDSSETSIAAVRHGAQDYLVKYEFDARLLARALQFAVVRAPGDDRVGRELVNVGMAGGLREKMEKLSPRETELMEKIFSGKNLKQCSRCMGITYHTVKKHRLRLFQKMHVASEVQLMKLFVMAQWDVEMALRRPDLALDKQQ